MTNATIHERRAAEMAELARGDRTLPVARCSLRQGDAIMRRVGDAECDSAPDSGPSGELIAAGAHGHHRLVGLIRRVGDDRLDLPAGGVLVHTDEPEARHGAIRLAPGRWQIGGLRELDPDTRLSRRVAD